MAAALRAVCGVAGKEDRSIEMHWEESTAFERQRQHRGTAACRERGGTHIWYMY